MKRTSASILVLATLTLTSSQASADNRVDSAPKTCPDSVCFVSDPGLCMGPDSCPPAAIYNQPLGTSHDSGFFVGGGFYYVKPRWKGNTAFYSSVVQSDGSVNFAVEEFDYGYDFAPRVRLGYSTPSGLGVRATYWRFSEGAGIHTTNAGVGNESQISVPLPVPPQLTNPILTAATPQGLLQFSPTLTSPLLDLFGDLVPPEILESLAINDLLTFDSHLRLDVADLEVMNRIQFHMLTLCFSGGVRYTRLKETYRATKVAQNSTEFIQNLVVVDERTFEGAGPTVALEAHYPIGNTGLAAFTCTRGSILIGHQKETASATVQLGGLLDDIPPELVSQLAASGIGSSSSADVLPSTEVEIGAEWHGDLGRGPHILIRGGFVAQVWVGTGNPLTQANRILSLAGLDLLAGVTW